MPAEPRKEAASRRADRRGDNRSRRRAAAPSFPATMSALDALVSADARVSVHASDLDSGAVLLRGDDHIAMPIAGLGVVPLLVEAAARFDDGTIDPGQPAARGGGDPLKVPGLWRHLRTAELPLGDLALLAAASGDALAANAVLDAVGHEAVTRRLVALGMPRSALLDRFRADRGPDDAPHLALGTTGEFAALFAALVAGDAVSAGASAQVAEWLTLNQDLGLVGEATGLDPFAHDDDRHGLLLVNRTGRSEGVRAEAGVLAGARGAVSYALFVEFADRSILHRDRAHAVFHAFSRELMEYVA